jgi:hypothetical protein
MYVAGGRRVVAPVCARLAFVIGALLLEANSSSVDMLRVT